MCQGPKHQRRIKFVPLGADGLDSKQACVVTLEMEAQPRRGQRVDPSLERWRQFAWYLADNSRLIAQLCVYDATGSDSEKTTK